MPSLQLKVTDYQDIHQWRWELCDEHGNFMADHEVRLDKQADEYQGYENLPAYLKRYRGAFPENELLNRTGAWMGDQVFAGLRDKLRDNLSPPATVIQVSVPKEAQNLLFRPFELAHLEPDLPMVNAGIRFIYRQPGAALPRPKPSDNLFRVLAVFSLPTNQNPLNLRRERYLLKKKLEELASARGFGLYLRILQYGATRKTLEDALREAPGWDMIHFSGHGEQGAIVLEKDTGESDSISAADLSKLLIAAKKRLKFLILSACWSGAANLAFARSALGMDSPKRGSDAEDSDAEEIPAIIPLNLPSLGQELSASLDCAALCMRYPVGDQFAIDLVQGMFSGFLEHGSTAPDALQFALTDALQSQNEKDRLFSAITPILFGSSADTLCLTLSQSPQNFGLAKTGLFEFPPEPERFVGRLIPMMKANAALALRSPMRGVLFYGMTGAGKTACALELAYRHERGRFTGYAFFKCPEQGADISTALGDCLHAIERQLDMNPGDLTVFADRPKEFEERACPRIRQLLSANAILLVIDNMESLLTDSGAWRDEKWKDFINALLSHTGTSRTVLTSRRAPAALENHAALLRVPIHALSFAETVLLAREMPNLSRLFENEKDLELLKRALTLIQGHPKILEFAENMAADKAQFEKQVARTETGLPGHAESLRAFFDKGESAETEDDFITSLCNWTSMLTRTLLPTERLLFYFLCRLEDDDRILPVIQRIWGNFLNRLTQSLPDAVKNADPSEGALKSALDKLTQCGLIERSTEKAGDETRYAVHPGVAEAGRGEASVIPAHAGIQQNDSVILTVADFVLGEFYGSLFQYGLENEMQGGTRLVIHGARRAIPYLMRGKRWEQAATVIENLIYRDQTPATLNHAIPLLRRIAEQTKGTKEEYENAGLVAKALTLAGRYEDAEQLLKDLIARCEQEGDFRTASNASNQLLYLLMENGRLNEALRVAEKQIDLDRQAGLGLWTQLGDETQRLQILNAMGRYAEVLAAVEKHRETMRDLPEKSDADDTVNPYNVREAMLDTSRSAAMKLQQWETALSLNAEKNESKRERGADEAEMAGTMFNDYSPLIRLQRFDQARVLLETCRDIFDRHRNIAPLARTYGALADLEDKQNNHQAAVQFEKTALKYSYQAGQPNDCAISHNNLSNYLERAEESQQIWLAHRVAAGIIWLLIGSGNLQIAVNNLANSDLPPTPPRFAEVASIVEQIDGVRFAELFARLPRQYPDGDAAIGALWALIEQEKQEKGNALEALLKILPESLLEALQAGDQEKFLKALQELPEDEVMAVMKAMGGE
jgi:tetratricopeptide (TPR) repeat protein